ncbi:pak-1 [Acrasis kona]|uniref:Pak-1 n=1 Tax=Acrasis kona TaxID=1008807 RepID=A0AAW2YJT0_9EUKA
MSSESGNTLGTRTNKKGFFARLFTFSRRKKEVKPVAVRPTIGKPKNFQHVRHVGHDTMGDVENIIAPKSSN